jgi:hypothetical protein
MKIYAKLIILVIMALLATSLFGCGPAATEAPVVTEAPEVEVTEAPEPEVTEAPTAEVTEAPEPEVTEAPVTEHSC